MYLVDGARLIHRAYDLDRDKQMQLPTIRFTSAQVFRFNPALHASGARYSSGKGLLVVIGADLDLRRRADSTLPVPADGAGGLRLS
jgi:hypothetical protein